MVIGSRAIENPIFTGFVPHPMETLQCHSVVGRNFTITKIAYNTGVQSLCLPNLLRGGTYNKGERLSVKFSFRPFRQKTSQCCEVTV